MKRQQHYSRLVKLDLPLPPKLKLIRSTLKPFNLPEDCMELAFCLVQIYSNQLVDWDRLEHICDNTKLLVDEVLRQLRIMEEAGLVVLCLDYPENPSLN